MIIREKCNEAKRLPNLNLTKKDKMKLNFIAIECKHLQMLCRRPFEWRRCCRGWVGWPSRFQTGGRYRKC